MTLTAALGSLRAGEHARAPSLQGPPAFKPPFRPRRPCRYSLSTAGGLIQPIPNITGPASVTNFHLPNLIMRYVVGGGGTNHPWLFPLTHSKLSVVVRKASKQTIQVQALNHIVLTSLNRSSGCGVERCLICITKYCTTSAVVVICCLPLNYCERKGGCHLTSSSRLSHVGRCEGTGLVRRALQPIHVTSRAVLLALCRFVAMTSTGIF